VGIKARSQHTKWTTSELALVDTLTEQLGAALESARLYDVTQRAAMMEQTISEVSAGVRAETEIEQVLERALVELGMALGAERGAAMITVASEGGTVQEEAQARHGRAAGGRWDALGDEGG